MIAKKGEGTKRRRDGWWGGGKIANAWGAKVQANSSTEGYAGSSVIEGDREIA